MIDREEIERLDKLRWDDPKKVNKKLERILAGPSRDNLAEILVVYGASFRQLDRLADARWAYYAAELCAEAADDIPLLAKIYQRSSWVEFYDGRFDAALKLLRLASGTFLEVGDPNNGAKVLVDTALQWLERGNHRRAVTCAGSGLRNLGPEEYWNRFSAHQILASGNHALGHPTAALSNLEEARALLGKCPAAFSVRFRWQEAEIKSEILPPEQAVGCFEEAADFFGASGEHLDCLLALLEYAERTLALGWHGPLRKAAEKLKHLAFQADSDSAQGRVSGAVALRVAQAIDCGRATQALLRAAMERVRQAGAESARRPR